MEFKNKEFDGPCEVSEIQINNNGQLLRGLLYFPSENFKKPYSVVIYFHGFPQIFSLTEIVKNYKFLLDLGYAFIVFNFRGFRFSEGQVSINSQVSDSLKIIEFVEIMIKNNIFNINDINILGHDFGAYIALILCSKINLINRLLLISPILNVKKLVYSEDFPKTLSYINRFLPGNVKGIKIINQFIDLIKEELNNIEFQIENFLNYLKNRLLKIIIGSIDKLSPLSEVKTILTNANMPYELISIIDMDHDCVDDEELEKLNKEIINYFI